MLRDDLKEARKIWVSEVKHDPKQRLRREQSDFLSSTNHAGESIDFHSLRHTCGAWLAKTGAHPKVVQTVMRHSAITLTMDTYGHLFPGQAAEAVTRLQTMLSPASQRTAQATGTDDLRAQRLAQRAEREQGQNGASQCESEAGPRPQRKMPKSLQVMDLGDVVRGDALGNASSGRGTRTPDTRIMIPLL